MAVHKSLATPLLFALLAGCAALSAEAPLFSLADQTGPPPLTEGVWIALGEGCAEHNLRRRRFPSDCMPLDIRRDEDGAWRVSVRADLVSDITAAERAEAENNPSNGPYRVILAPAVERPMGDSYAPVYLGEVVSLAPGNASVAYAVIAPINSMPATEMHLIAFVDCGSVLRDGPIEGIMTHYEPRTDDQGVERQELRGCIASTQAAVREAVRRAVIENLNELTDRRFVFVRAN
jgi:hypothetical protein